MQVKLYLVVTKVHLFTGSLLSAGLRPFFIAPWPLRFQTICKHLWLIMCQFKSILFPDYALCLAVLSSLTQYCPITCPFFDMFPCACILVSNIALRTHRFNVCNWCYAINVSCLCCGVSLPCSVYSCASAVCGIIFPKSISYPTVNYSFPRGEYPRSPLIPYYHSKTKQQQKL